MILDRCTKCGEIHFDNESCKPIFYINLEDYHGDDWEKIRAINFKQAAEKWCQLEDIRSVEYNIIKNGGLDEIKVKDSKDIVKKFKIHAETLIEYTATELK